MCRTVPNLSIIFGTWCLLPVVFTKILLKIIKINEIVWHPIFFSNWHQMGRAKRICYLSPMRAAKVQASLRIRAVSPEPSLLAHTSSELRGTFRQKARSLAHLNGWACAVKICHDGMLEDTNSLDGAQIQFSNCHAVCLISQRLSFSCMQVHNKLIVTIKWFTENFINEFCFIENSFLSISNEILANLFPQLNIDLAMITTDWKWLSDFITKALFFWQTKLFCSLKFSVFV